MNKKEYSRTETVVSPDGRTVTTSTVSVSSGSSANVSSTSVSTSVSVTVQNGEKVISSGKDAEK